MPVGLTPDTLTRDTFLTIQLTHHHIQDAEQSDEIRDLRAEAYLFQRRDVDERWGPDVITPRIRLAVRDDIEGEFTFGRFDPTVRFSGRYPDLILRFLRVDSVPGEFA